ncbi:MAG: RNA-dependent DNA polymerase [Parcubacteria group bacterium]|nr:RNA-dependent DNA polymerase [Parcubacteria group bacterium]
MKIKLTHKFEDIISLDNLLLAWKEFLIGKKSKKDVQVFSFNLVDNIVALQNDLVNKTYKHGDYHSFYITDPKCRHIHKASVRDRLLHHAIYRILYPFFDRTFISDSFSCRLDKGTHKALNRFKKMAYRVSKNHTKTYWVLKCDIKKFFASIDHQILLNILQDYIPDKNIIWLLNEVIKSFRTDPDKEVGLPLGNLTSQLFANVYMNKLDQHVKHKLKIKYYIRYADDFVFLNNNKEVLVNLIPTIQNFLQKELKLSLHENKVSISTFSSGVGFLGWNHFIDHRTLRKTTKKRMFKRIKENPKQETLQSYVGLLNHGNTTKIKGEVGLDCWLWKDF